MLERSRQALRRNTTQGLTLLQCELQNHASDSLHLKLSQIVEFLEQEDEVAAARLWKDVRLDCEQCGHKRREYMEAIVVCVDATFRNLEIHAATGSCESLVDLSDSALMDLTCALTTTDRIPSSKDFSTTEKGCLRRCILCGAGLATLGFGVFILLAPSPEEESQLYAKWAIGVFFAVGGIFGSLWSLVASNARIDAEFEKLWDRL